MIVPPRSAESRKEIRRNMLATAVLHDVRTMPRYFQEFVHRQSGPGLILIPQKLALSGAVDELVPLWKNSKNCGENSQVLAKRVRQHSLRDLSRRCALPSEVR